VSCLFAHPTAAVADALQQPQELHGSRSRGLASSSLALKVQYLNDQQLGLTGLKAGNQSGPGLDGGISIYESQGSRAPTFSFTRHATQPLEGPKANFDGRVACGDSALQRFPPGEQSALHPNSG